MNRTLIRPALLTITRGWRSCPRCRHRTAVAVVHAVRTLRLTEATMMFLNCPARLDQEVAVRCGLPAEVRCRFTMRSTDGPLESVMITCPAGHSFTGPIEVLTPGSTDSKYPGRAGLGSPTERDGTTGREDM